MTPQDNLQIVLNSRPHGAPTAENFAQRSVPVPAPRDGEVLLRTIYLSLDPYMRGRMNDAKSYVPPFALGDVLGGATVSEVLESHDDSLKPGDFVLSHVGWQQFGLQKAKHLRRLDPAMAPISTAVGVLGMPGFTAYAGLTQIGKPQPGETLAVAAATGPVGSVVGQIAKINGLSTIGIAGGAAKVKHLVDLGFDEALDHRSPHLRDELKAAAPEGIDIYFENVGGAVWDAILPRLNTFARVPLCGLVADYNLTEAPTGPDRGPRMMRAILTKSITVRGFIQNEFEAAHFGAFLDDMGAWVRDGAVQYREDIVQGLTQAPEAFAGLLEGKNFGKLLIQVGDDPTRSSGFGS
ncbi:NADP-dependent oxidoreductase [soil metagenome]